MPLCVLETSNYWPFLEIETTHILLRQSPRLENHQECGPSQPNQPMKSGLSSPTAAASFCKALRHWLKMTHLPAIHSPSRYSDGVSIDLYLRAIPNCGGRVRKVRDREAGYKRPFQHRDQPRTELKVAGRYSKTSTQEQLT